MGFANSNWAKNRNIATDGEGVAIGISDEFLNNYLQNLNTGNSMFGDQSGPPSQGQQNTGNSMFGGQSGPPSQRQQTVAGIYRPEDGPVGGYAMPNQTYTGYTGSREAAFGADKGRREGTGGGIAIRQEIPENELILARPDLQGGQQFQQYASTPISAPVTPIDNEAGARAQALRMQATGG